VTRKKKPVASADVVAARTLMRTATGSPVSSRRRIQTLPTTTKSGFPGGCGIPMMNAVAMYSLVSQNQVVGARVRR
jgi:hypothetical protein